MKKIYADVIDKWNAKYKGSLVVRATEEATDPVSIVVSAQETLCDTDTYFVSEHPVCVGVIFEKTDLQDVAKIAVELNDMTMQILRGRVAEGQKRLALYEASGLRITSD